MPRPVYSPDGKWLVFLSYDTDRAFNDQGHLTLLARRGGKMRALAPSFDRAAMHVQWSADSAALLFLAEDRGRVGTVSAAAGGGAAGAGRARRQRSRASRARATAACSRSRVRTATHPPALFASRGDGSGERPIESLNRALLARHALGEVREFTVKGWHGEPVQVWVDLSARIRLRRRSGRCCIRSTADRTRRTRTAGTSAGTRRCSPGAATSSRA